MHIKAVILLMNFSFGSINFVDLSTTIFIQVFYVFYIFHKNAFFNVFYSWGQRFLHLWLRMRYTFEILGRCLPYVKTIRLLFRLCLEHTAILITQLPIEAMYLGVVI